MSDVVIKGADSLMHKLEVMPDKLHDALWDANFDIVQMADEAAVRELQSSMKHSSGELASSLKYEVMEDTDGHVVGRLWSDDPVAVYRELGTGLVGEASPKKLPEGVNPVYTQHAWFIPADKVDTDLNAVYGMPLIMIGGKKFYRTNGQPARQFMGPAIEKAGEDGIDVLKAHVKKGLNELGDL
ncbi:HK97 gp10 family phage protein [Levilactobacillus enshiensis]|uniref:HK97 gp10 family phage protein n=1 Tax=Levilactobacillus enshiensis TaxID=2590213 RepID=UPI00117A4F5D|nr:HK97 gp10 family phage protein [Levilactobacillus enshiensis]